VSGKDCFFSFRESSQKIPLSQNNVILSLPKDLSFSPEMREIPRLRFAAAKLRSG
jgi:hypothetical protein